MESKTFTTKEVLQELRVPYFIFEYLIRTNQVKPIAEGRSAGRERRFTEEELEKAKNLTRHHISHRAASKE